jgi:hypothetical protein
LVSILAIVGHNFFGFSVIRAIHRASAHHEKPEKSDF